MLTENVIGLVVQLAELLQAKNINYCHWKSNSFLNRSLSGDNDLDLLICREDANRFTTILYNLGFKETLLPRHEELPGVRNYYGLDQDSGKLVHVHAHFQLILGNDLSKNYHLPLEKAYLDSATLQGLLRVPAPEFELVVLVIRMILKHATWDAILMRHTRISATERRELIDLSTVENLARIEPVLRQFPGLGQGMFERCLQALQPGCPTWPRIHTAEQLQKILAACARHPHWLDLAIKLFRRIWQPILLHGFKFSPKNRFANGGLFVAIVGGDGAGKTTVIDELHQWLAGKYEIKKLHMGKPAWSWTTIIMRGILKIGTLLQMYSFEGDTYEETYQSHGYPWFIRSVCTARDRYLTFVQARRLASNGCVVVCDRYSFPGFMQMDGPQCGTAVSLAPKNSRLLNTLIRQENNYYSLIGQPDLLIVLKVDPEIAVRRKVDETETSVRARSTEVWELDWHQFSAFEVNASLTREEVLSQVKNLLWEHL